MRSGQRQWGLCSWAVALSLSLAGTSVWAQRTATEGIRVTVNGRSVAPQAQDPIAAFLSEKAGQSASGVNYGAPLVAESGVKLIALPKTTVAVTDSEDDLENLIQRQLGTNDLRAGRQSSQTYQELFQSGSPYDSMSAQAALVIDGNTSEVLYSKNEKSPLPIASITKLMTALVVLEAQQPMEEVLTITNDDVDKRKGSSSRLNPGTQLTREQMLQLALMSSENRAANALARHYPGGWNAAVEAMNRKAQKLGMRQSQFVDPTGLYSENRASALDLTLLVKEAARQPTIRFFSTAPEADVFVGTRIQQFRSTNALVRNPLWAVNMQKTGYISEAGRCMVMQGSVGGRNMIMVLLGAPNASSRFADAERVRMLVSPIGY